MVFSLPQTIAASVLLLLAVFALAKRRKSLAAVEILLAAAVAAAGFLQSPHAVFVLCGAGFLCGGALALGSHFLSVDEDPRIAAIAAALPGANCGGCGFAGCAQYAEAISKGEAPFCSCAPGGLASAVEIAKIMGEDFDGKIESFTAVVKCGGDNSHASKHFLYNGIKDCAAAAAVAGGDKGCPYGCLGYGSCARVCSRNAIEIANGIAKVHPGLCAGCGACVKACPRHVIELLPKSLTVHVLCKSKDSGAAVKKYCSRGCIGCRICAKFSNEGAIIFDGPLARVNNDIPFEGEEAIAKCPAKCLRKDSPGENS